MTDAIEVLTQGQPSHAAMNIDPAWPQYRYIEVPLGCNNADYNVMRIWAPVGAAFSPSEIWYGSYENVQRTEGGTILQFRQTGGFHSAAQSPDIPIQDGCIELTPEIYRWLDQRVNTHFPQGVSMTEPHHGLPPVVKLNNRINNRINNGINA